MAQDLLSVAGEDVGLDRAICPMVGRIGRQARDGGVRNARPERREADA